MKRRFVVLAAPLDAEAQRKFRQYLENIPAPWWHWVDNAWLLVTDDDDVKAEHIRDQLLELNPAARIAVFEFPEDVDWATSGSKNASGKMIADWLKSAWAKK